MMDRIEVKKPQNLPHRLSENGRSVRSHTSIGDPVVLRRSEQTFGEKARPGIELRKGSYAPDAVHGTVLL